ncbi:dicarboxylate/amino acid:cation symporter [Paraburkholderia hospita]|uniref:dicarboxylate/amino acid:cation symporter n=1 Tax=Paraburkholderia hospita TaxID=169430 RepID=UPI0009A7415D|nr:dicarboxylate/amino acid:cation symporter [Paraburkholderia hospita]SKC93720.1 aerobic C4-dicarboxylate transport protein [Paraburkholderia hospita]
MRQPFYKVLYVQVLLAIAAGILLGHLYPQYATAMKPLGDAFIRLIRMIIGPVIFCTVVAGISSMSDLKKVGRVGGKALVCFEVVSSIALVIGLLAGHVLHPGDGFNVSVASLDTRAIAGFVSQSEHLDGLTGFLFGIIPVSFFDAFAKGDTLPILFVSVMFGIAISAAGEQASGVTAMIEKLSAVFFSLVKIITKAAPAGAFGAISFTVGKYGIASLIPLFKLILTFYVTAFIFIAVVLGTFARMAGFSVFRLLAYLKDELLIVLGTSTSEAVLPQLMQKLERLGCSKAVVGLVVPTGYSFNLDGANIYMTLAVLFLAQATNIHLTTGQELTLLAVTMLTSKGSSAVVGAGFVALAASLSVVPTVPVAAMVLILGIDRFMAECRSLVNAIGNAVAVVVVSAWEGELDRSKMHAVLYGERDQRVLIDGSATLNGSQSVDSQAH